MDETAASAFKAGKSNLSAKSGIFVMKRLGALGGAEIEATGGSGTKTEFWSTGGGGTDRPARGEECMENVEKAFRLDLTFSVFFKNCGNLILVYVCPVEPLS
jgi:hypothetical protein